MKIHHRQHQKITTLLLGISLMSFAFSCKTISIQNKQHFQTSQNISLGSIGNDETFILEKTYSSIGIPKYFKPVKVNITLNSFNNSTYSAFNDAKLTQNKTIKINYQDSLKVKPNFINLDISDRITLINQLNHKENIEIKNFLSNQNETHIVTSVSIVFDQANSDAIQNAQEVFIQQSGINSIALKLYTESKLDKTILFSEGIIFSYRTASVCWKENNMSQLEIVDLVEGDNSCPDQTYSSSKRAKKDINYYKF